MKYFLASVLGHILVYTSGVISMSETEYKLPLGIACGISGGALLGVTAAKAAIKDS